MPLRAADRLPVINQQFPFSAWRAHPEVMTAAHTHTDIEFNLLLRGKLSYFFAGRFVDVEEGALAIFWAGAPHRLIALAPDGETEYLCMTLPLAWFLSWNIDGGKFAERLLSGALFAWEATVLERELFGRWAKDFPTSSTVPPRATLLEVEAFLHRTARESHPPGANTVAPRDNAAIGEQTERIASYVGVHYQDPDLSVTTIAAAIPMHPKYALAVFKERVGMTLWDYVTRLRVSHAQRLLITTDWGVERIALESGFASASRFFAAFRKQTGGVTPRRWRTGTASG